MYLLYQKMQKSKKGKKIQILAISDTHGNMKSLQPLTKMSGDIFIHAGDFTRYGKQQDFIKFFDYLDRLKYKHKIVISGNHEIMLDNGCILPKQKIKFLAKNKCDMTKQKLVTQLKKRCHYLQHEYIEIDGVRIFASPYTPVYCGTAFQYGMHQDKIIWDQIPKKLDILITHGPPHGICDLTKKNKNAGSFHLAKVVKQIGPKYHIFGHIHQATGMQKYQNTTFINVAGHPTRLILTIPEN